jgi:hypothetical protein
MKRCSCCGQDLPAEAFLRLKSRGRGGWRVRYCNDCAARNMAAYWAARPVAARAGATLKANDYE